MPNLTVNTVIDTFMQATTKAGMRSAMDAAPLADPTFTGVPAAPTAAGGTNTTQLASTAFVQQELASKSYIDGEVTYYADLPIVVGTPAVGVVYLVKTWSVTNPFSFPGAWMRTGNAGALSDWTRLGNEADMFADAYFRIYDDSDSTKKLAFSVGGATTGKTVTIASAHTDNRTITLPDATGTVALTSDLPAAAIPASYLDTDGALAANSDVKVASQKATKTYADTKTTAAAALAAALGGGTWTGDHTFGENTGLVLDPALSADGKYCGIVEASTAGAALSFGDLCYFAVADSRWELTDADAAATAGPVKLGICVLAAAGDGSATAMLLWGKVRADAAFPTLTVGAPVYVGLTAGDVAVTETWGTDDVIRVIGYGNTANELFFCPSRDYITYV